MSDASHVAASRPGAVQTAGNGAVVGSRRCEVCGAVLRGRQRVACSDKCRAMRWRRQGEAASRAEVEGVRQTVRILRASVDDLAERLEQLERLARRTS